MRSKEGTTVKLLVRAGEVDVKVEVTPVLRGTVFAPDWRRVSPATEDWFGFAEAQVVSPADLYAGKLVAALDRQHPRHERNLTSPASLLGKRKAQRWNR